MKRTQQAAKRAVENLYYTGICTVIERKDIRDEVTKISRKTEVPVMENQPCRLSFERLLTTSQTETAADLRQGAKLFVPSEIVIKEGSKIIVEQDGRRTVYAASGEPAVYPTHQEIMLELFAGWA